MTEPELNRQNGPLHRTWAALRRLPRVQEAGLLVVILIMAAGLAMGGGSIKSDGEQVNNFLRAENLITNVANPASYYAIMALGATVVIIAGGIDLSVGSVMALSALSAAAVLQRFEPEASGPALFAAGLLTPLVVGLLCGLVNGFLVVSLRMHPFIVTLGTLYIYRGIALVSVPSKTLPSMDPETLMPRAIPDAFTDGFIGWGFTLGDTVQIQPVPMLVMLGCIAGGWVLLSHSVIGRQVYAVGGNEEAARFAGIPIQWVQVGVYSFSGLMAGVAGMLSVGYYGSATTSTGLGYELVVIAAAVVGGASLRGGRGTALGAMLGAIVIQLIENGILLLDRVDLGFVSFSLKQEYANIINGAAIIVAVAVDRLSEQLARRRLAALAQQQATDTRPVPHPNEGQQPLSDAADRPPSAPRPAPSSDPGPDSPTDPHSPEQTP